MREFNIYMQSLGAVERERERERERESYTLINVNVALFNNHLIYANKGTCLKDNTIIKEKIGKIIQEYYANVNRHN